MRDNWTLKKVSDFGEIITGSTPSTKINEYWYGNYPFYSPADFDGKKYCSSTERQVSQTGLNTGRILKENSILFTCIGSIGKMAISTKTGISNQQINAVTVNKDYDYEFVYYLLNFHKEKFKSVAPMTTIQIINKSDFGAFRFSIPPSLNHQRKIAKILNTVDSVIEKTEAAIAKYKALKHGMMQDFFTRGIDTQTGKLRPTQKEAPELYKVDSISKSKLGMEALPSDWKIKKLSDIIYLRHGYQFRDYDFVQEGIDVIKIGQVGKNGKINLSNSSKISSHRSKEFEGISLKNGDILMALTGATLGKTALVKGINKPLVQNYRVGFFTPKKETEIHKPFLYYLLAGDYVQNEILGFVNTGAQGNIGKADFEKIKVSFPSDYSEQKKIADRLLKIDGLIEKEQANLSKHQSLKKGLMQDLLTGKVEVEV